MIHHVDIECPAGTSACCNQSKFKKVAKVHKGLSWYIKTIIQCLKKSTLKTIDISQLIGIVGIDHPICIGPAYISSIKMMSTKENYAIGRGGEREGSSSSSSSSIYLQKLVCYDNTSNKQIAC